MKYAERAVKEMGMVRGQSLSGGIPLVVNNTTLPITSLLQHTGDINFKSTFFKVYIILQLNYFYI